MAGRVRKRKVNRPPSRALVRIAARSNGYSRDVIKPDRAVGLLKKHQPGIVPASAQ